MPIPVDDEVEEVGRNRDLSTPMPNLVDADQVLPESLPESVSSAYMFVPQSTATAKIIKRMSTVRFASAEKLLAEYISLRDILVTLTQSEEFETLYSSRNEAEKVERNQSFVKPILDDSLFKRVKQAQAILSICHTYFRVFDKETALCSEVYERTRILEKMLQTLPHANFPEPREENFKHLLKVFQNRKEGLLPGMKRVRITLLSDLHYAAALMDPFRTPRSNFPYYLSALRHHLANYYAGADADSLGQSTDELIDQIVD